MKRLLLSLVIFLFWSMFMTSCASKEKNTSNSDEKACLLPDELRPESIYTWEIERREVAQSEDMVLIYAGGKQRDTWTVNRMSPYVSYLDCCGQYHWLFDSFLFLEITDTKDWIQEGKTFAKGYGEGIGLKSATKADWLKLIKEYFDPKTGIGALNLYLESAIKLYGSPEYDRQIVIGIPEPIVTQYWNDLNSNTVYWGEIDGVEMDFKKLAHRIKACKWFINQVRAHFDKAAYNNLKLAGFYWIAEDVTTTSELLNPLSEYLKRLKYNFNWIPYFLAEGRSEWSHFGFSKAYYQPNYFFHLDTSKQRLNQACDEAEEYGMAMELEFDERVLTSNGALGKRLRDYMEVFREKEVWKNKSIAYYQGFDALYRLAESVDSNDEKLYHEFCSFVTNRSSRHPKIQ